MSLKAKLGILAAGLMLSGCMQATTYEATNTDQLQAARQGTAGQDSLRQGRRSPSRSAAPSSTITARKRPGSIVVDSDNHYLYYVHG